MHEFYINKQIYKITNLVEQEDTRMNRPYIECQGGRRLTIQNILMWYTF